MQIQISWLLQKPTDLDLHCLQRQGISGFSRSRVKTNVYVLQCYLLRSIKVIRCSLRGDSYVKIEFAPSENGSTLKRKEGEHYFPFRVDPFSVGVWCAGTDVNTMFQLIYQTDVVYGSDRLAFMDIKIHCPFLNATLFTLHSIKNTSSMVYWCSKNVSSGWSRDSILQYLDSKSGSLTIKVERPQRYISPRLPWSENE